MSTLDNLILPFDAFVRSFKQNKDASNSFLIGAGTSISSGIQSANDCIWEWKKDIYCSNKDNASKVIQNYKTEIVQKIIQDWLDKKGCYPQLGDDNEYSFYAEKAYPIEGDRVKYFTGLSKDKTPYVGYKLLCLLNKFGIVKSVWSTNFDGLVPRAAQQLNITPIEINLDNEKLIYRNACDSELLYVALHGDYKYSKLKNTSKELDTQSGVFANALKHYFVDKNLIVCGYSGRDKSLMDALTSAFSEKGSGRIYWCGYGEDIPTNVREFLLAMRQNGRECYYIATDGFDRTMISLAKACVENDNDKAVEVDEILKVVNSDESHTTKFQINHSKKDKYLKSNLYPVTIPKETFVLDIGINAEKGPWRLLKDLTNNHPIIAVPFKNKVYAFSTHTELNSVFGNRLKDNIHREPISTKDIRSISNFKSLYLSSILYGLASRIGLNTDRKHKIWKTQPKQVTSSGVKVYEAIECDLVFKENAKYILLSLKPSLWIDDKTKLTKEELLRISADYLNPLRNKFYDEKLIEWETLLFGQNTQISFDIPLNSQSDFKFAISRNRAFASVSVLDTNYSSYQPNGFNEKKLLYHGVQLSEPKLEFVNDAGSISEDDHPMRGLISHKPYDSLLNVFSSAIDLGVICPNSKSDLFYNFLNNLNKTIETDAKSDYVIGYNGFSSVYKVNLNIPNIGSDRWSTINESQSDSYKLAQDICKKIEDLYSNHTGIVITVFIPKQWEAFRSFKKDGEEFDLHDYIKAFSAQKNITTQIIEESTLYDSKSFCQIIWWLSLAFYVKAKRTPWTLANMSPDTAFAGIGYGIKKSLSGKSEIVLGCSHIYNAKGEGLKYKLSKVENPHFDHNDHKKNPYLTYDEAFKLGVSIRELFMQSMNELPKRVVVHKRTPFKQDEIKGITDALKRAGIDDVDLVEINIEDSFRFMSQKIYNGNMETDGFPLSRGTCIQIAPYQALLWTHGIVPSVRNENYRYYAGGRSIPAPLRIVKHYGNGDLYTIANEILGFTKMNWNSFNLYTKLPATLDSSSILARVGKLLSKYEGKTYDYRYFI